MLKIGRVLADQTLHNVKGDFATGPYPYSYPNGLEITSVISEVKSSILGANKSVAIAVGAINNYADSKGGKKSINTTGFFVSDTGENVGIGGLPLYGVASLSVTSGSNASAIETTGNVDVVGNFSVTGDVSILNNTGITTLRTVSVIDTAAEYNGDYIGFVCPSGSTGNNPSPPVQSPYPYYSLDYNLISAAPQGTSASVFPATSYDRYITFDWGGNSTAGGTATMVCYVSKGTDPNSGNYYLVERRAGISEFNAASFLVPSGSYFKVGFSNPINFRTNFNVIERKFGK
jgi:hypothetical protein